MTDCFAYLRVSGKGQVDGDGFPRQEAAIRAYAAREGYNVVKVFAEKGVCGEIETMERPAFMDMMNELSDGGVKAVIVEKLDRLSRQLIVQEMAIRDLSGKGLTLLSADPAEADLMANDPGRVLVRQMFGAIAQYDKAMLVAKLRSARVRAKASGKRVEGQKPFGHRPGEVATIKRLKALRAEGYPYQKIADIMNAEGIRARHGLWHATSVKRVLTAVLPIKESAVSAERMPAAASLTAVQADVVSALVNLGSQRADAGRAVRSIGTEHSDFDGLFRAALQSVR